MNLYSRIKPNTLLHIIHRKEDWIDGRQDLTPETTALQVATIKQPAGQTFRPHKHIPNERIIPITNECWVILTGSVKATYYDIDNSVLHEDVLLPGDVTITVGEGGHNYLFMKDGVALEVKNGPWVGTETDKEFICEQL